MLKKLGNIFKSNLPIVSEEYTAIENGLNITNYTRYTNNANIFRTFIKIDAEKAKQLNLSYFKTATINYTNNSRFSIENLGYTKLLERNQYQNIDLNNFVYNNLVYNNQNIDTGLNLINQNILGRNLNLSDLHNKLSIQNFASRQSFNYSFGLTLLSNLNISDNQDLFFELNYNTTADVAGQYDLIIYAMDINDQIIDVKKISNFNPSFVRWNIDRTTFLYDTDNIDYSKLFGINFNSSFVFNNFRREFSLFQTQNFKSIKSSLGFSPIESISIQENTNLIEIQNNNIQVNTAFQNTDSIKITCNENLNLISVPFAVTYKLFMKVTGRNSYIIKNFSQTVTNPTAISTINIQNILNTSLNNTKITYLTNLNTIKIELSLLKSAFNNESFNPVLANIFINNENNHDFISECFSNIPIGNNLNDLNLSGIALKNIVISSKNQNENNYIFYLRNILINPLTINFVFRQNFQKYYQSFNIETIYEKTDYNQSLTIRNNSINIKQFSNLDIGYNLKIKNFKNSNTNLNRFLTLNYENIFLQELQDGTTQLNSNFENNIFVIIKKSIYQESEHIKDKYYIFNKDIFQNINLSLNVDLNLDLNFKDDIVINSLFFKEFEYDNVDTTKNVRYTFDARIMIIPLGFFITNTEYTTKKRIKELLSIGNNQLPIPSQGQIDEIYFILKNINENKFSSLNQVFLYKLYQSYCLKETQASNEIILDTRQNIQLNLNELFLTQISADIIQSNNQQTKTLNFTLNFNIKMKESDDNMFNLLINEITSYFQEIYFKYNREYINLINIIPQFTSYELLAEFQNINIQTTITTSSLQLKLSLNISPELLRFFSLAKNKSQNDFTPYPYNFLNQNLYFKLNIPESISKNVVNNNLNITDTINFRNVLNQYALIDFYSLLN